MFFPSLIFTRRFIWTCWSRCCDK